jgi:hypothetical protein
MATPRSIPIQNRPKIGRYVLSGVGLALIALGYFTIPHWWEKREMGKWRIAVKAREEQLARFAAWLEVGTCVRRESSGRWTAALATPTKDALQDLLDDAPLVDPDCSKALAPIATDPDLPGVAHAAMRDWTAANTKLAAVAAGLPDPAAVTPALRAAITARDRILERARRDLVVPVRDRIRTVEQKHAAKHDYQWWHLECGFLLEDLLDRAYEAQAVGGDVAAAIRAPLAALRKKHADADTAFVATARVPQLDLVDRGKPEQAFANVRRIDDNAEWRDMGHDNSVFGPMPEEPDGCQADE